MLVVIGRVRPILFVSCSQSLLIFIVIMIDENAVISRFVNGMSLKDMEVLCNVYMVVLMIFFYDNEEIMLQTNWLCSSENTESRLITAPMV